MVNILWLNALNKLYAYDYLDRFSSFDMYLFGR